MGQNNSYEWLKEPDSKQHTKNSTYHSSGIQNPLFSTPQSSSWKPATHNSNNSQTYNSTDKNTLISRK